MSHFQQQLIRSDCEAYTLDSISDLHDINILRRRVQLARYWNTWASLEMSLIPFNNHTRPSRPTQIDNMTCGRGQPMAYQWHIPLT